MIRLTTSQFESICIQAKKEVPYEACGYLAGIDGAVKAVYPMVNVDHSEDHFSLDPKEQFAVIKQARQAGLDILAVYHSHPASPARPSKEDIRLAYDPNVVYVIVSLLGDLPDLKAFRIIDGVVSGVDVKIR